MKKLLLIIGIIVLISLSAFIAPKKGEKKKEEIKTEKKITPKNTTEKKPVIDNKLKEDIQSSVLEFINDMKVNPDTCYIPFKK